LTGDSIFEADLGRTAANFAPETPLTFLAWAAQVYPDKTAVVHGQKRFTYREFDQRCRRLASALQRRGIAVGDTVAVMSPNAPAMLEDAIEVGRRANPRGAREAGRGHRTGTAGTQAVAMACA